jgi:hypothetical protein
LDVLVALIKKPIQKTVGLLIVATVPAVVIALLTKKIAPVEAFFTRRKAGNISDSGFC